MSDRPQDRPNDPGRQAEEAADRIRDLAEQALAKLKGILRRAEESTR